MGIAYLLVHCLVITKRILVECSCLLSLLNEWGGDKIQVLPSIYHFSATSLINSLIQKHECLVLFYHRTLKLLRNGMFGMKKVNILSLCMQVLWTSLHNITQYVNY